MDSGHLGQPGPSVMRPVVGVNSDGKGDVTAPCPVAVGKTVWDMHRRYDTAMNTHVKVGSWEQGDDFPPHLVPPSPFLRFIKCSNIKKITLKTLLKIFCNLNL